MGSKINWDKCGHEAHCDAMECWTEENAWVICSRDGDRVDIAVPLCVTLSDTNGRLDDQFYTEIYDCYQGFTVRIEEWLKNPELRDCPQRGWWIYVVCTGLWYKIAPEDGLPPYEKYDRFNMKWRIHTKQMQPCFEWTPPNV